MDKRKTKLEYDEKEKIEWAARNLYQIIRVRSGITEEIRGKFYKSTIDKLYSREKNFNDIEDAISEAKDLVFNDNKYDILSIKEKEVWTSSFVQD